MPDAGEPGCTLKECGTDDGMGGKCFGWCYAVDTQCVGGPDWHCEGVCGGGTCGDDDGAGGKCYGTCPNAGETCQGGPNWTCVPTEADAGHDSGVDGNAPDGQFFDDGPFDE